MRLAWSDTSFPGSTQNEPPAARPYCEAEEELVASHAASTPTLSEVAATLAATGKQTDVVTLHPAAMERYRQDIERLAELLPRDALGDRDDLIDTIRNLVAAVIVQAPANEPRLRSAAGWLN